MQALIVSSLIGGLLAIVSILSQVELWQRKEYRWDRFLSWLRGPEGLATLLLYPALAALAIDAGWVAFMTNNSWRADFLGWVALTLFCLHHGQRIVRRGIFRPDFTFKAITLMGAVAAIALGYLALMFTPSSLPALQWATTILFMPFFTFAAVAGVNIPFTWKKQQVIKQATAKRQKLKNLAVIGITGSYGKTSTKHFLEHLLYGSQKNVVATHEHRNDAYPVALDFLARVTERTDMYIAEMAAYRRGEIKTIASMLQPRIGVLTAIGNQHLDLFGSLENIATAKWELIESLPDDGIAVLNADNSAIIEKAKKLKNEIIWYSTQKPADVYVSDAVIKTKSLECELHLSPTAHQHVTIPLASDGLLSSVVAATAAAVAVGTNPAQIFKQVQTVQAFPHTMEVVKGMNGATIIDNSYTANEAGVTNALMHLQRFPQSDKRIVLLPLIELGSAASEVHARIAKTIASTNARFYTVNHATDPRALLAAATNGLTADSVVLLAGRVPAVLVKTLRKNV